MLLNLGSKPPSPSCQYTEESVLPAPSLFHQDNGNKKSSTSVGLTPFLFLQIQLSIKNCLKFSNHISHCSRMTYFALEWTSEFIHINNYLQMLLFKIWTGISKKKKKKVGGAIVKNEDLIELVFFNCLIWPLKTEHIYIT